MSNEIKVGILVLIALVAVGYFVVKIEGFAGFDEANTYTVYVLFDNAAGLSVDDPVQLAGVSVGRVVRVQLTEDGKARVTLRLRRDIVLHADAVAAVGSTGMLGDRVLDVSPGTREAAVVADGGTIAGGQPVSIDQMVTVVSSIARNLDRTTESISSVLGSEEGEASLRQIVENLQNLTGRLDTMVADNRGSIDASLGTLGETLTSTNELTVALKESLPALVTEMRALAADISTLMGENKENFGAASANLEAMTERLDRSAADLEELMAKMNRGEGTVARLLNEPETVDRLNAALDSVDDSLAAADTFFRRIGEARFSFEWRSEFYERIETTKNYFGLRLEAGDVGSGRGFEFHIIDDNVGGIDETNITTEFFDPRTGELLDTTVERQIIRQEGFRFSAVLAQRLREFQIRGGILENQAGLGVDYFTAADRLRFTAEIWDLGRDPDPHAKLRFQWNVTGRFFVTGGWDDFLRDELRGYYVGFGYSFRQ